MAKRIFIILMIGLIGVFTFAGGGGEPKPAAGAAPKPAQEAGPKYGGTLTIGMKTTPQHLDIHMSPGNPGFVVLAHVNDYPIFHDAINSKLVPGLFKSWEVSDDATEYIFHIRQGVKFHSGEPLNAEAVKLSMDRHLDPACPTIAKAMWTDCVKEWVVVDEYTVKAVLKFPFAPFLYVLTTNLAPILSPKTLKENWTKPVTEAIGTGPFMVKDFEPAVSITLVRNPDYWGSKPENSDAWAAGGPYVDEIKYVAIPDDAARMVALETGEIDVAIAVPVADVARLKENPDVEVSDIAGASSMRIVANMLKKPYDDARVRKALNYAINKQAIVDNLLGGHASVSDCWVAPAVFGYAPTIVYEYNPDKAKQLLAEAGYSNGFDMDYYAVSGRYLMDYAVSAAVAADWTKVGIKVNMHMVDGATFSNLQRKLPQEAPMDIYLMMHGAGTCDVDQVGTVAIHSKSWFPNGTNYQAYSNPRADEILDTAREEPDQSKRLELYKELWQLTMVEDAMCIYMYVPNVITAYRANVHDMWFCPKDYQFAYHAWKD
jgi:peptide/nickel transport system substrate-binding protein